LQLPYQLHTTQTGPHGYHIGEGEGRGRRREEDKGRGTLQQELPATELVNVLTWNGAASRTMQTLE
jgi:hypothetical protein